eukprot:600722-Pleurochrysis_carterae.AAC.1
MTLSFKFSFAEALVKLTAPVNDNLIECVLRLMYEVYWLQKIVNSESFLHEIVPIGCHSRQRFLQTLKTWRRTSGVKIGDISSNLFRILDDSLC